MAADVPELSWLDTHLKVEFEPASMFETLYSEFASSQYDCGEVERETDIADPKEYPVNVGAKEPAKDPVRLYETWTGY